MRGLLLLVAARTAEASSGAAVLLVGAAYDVDEARLRATKKFVVDAFGASETLVLLKGCLLYTSPSPRDGLLSRMPSSA